MNRSDFNNLVKSSDFKQLFITELGWNNYTGAADIQPIFIDEKGYGFKTIAERSGFQVLVCETADIPTTSTCKKIDTKLRRYANDYIAIYTLPGFCHHQWVVPVKTAEKRELVTVEYTDAKAADFLFSKMDELCFELGEKTTIVDVKARVQRVFALNSEKITKDFYTGFKKEHSAFAKFITGVDDNIPVDDNRNKQWYTSVMLNRLMFCYFIQKKGFLDLDTDYLRHKLEWSQKEKGENRFFQTFYRGFLAQLFHDGLNAPRHSAEFEQTYGRIPYLNGGMFDEHQIEKEYSELDIADEAFIRLFDFFDKWHWHLDTRITASGKDINPDVLGYIFEQYINDRAQMGAYYTKEDITEYIGKNCIIPFIFDKMANSTVSSLFSPNGYVWAHLKSSGDRYVYDAMKKGYSPDWRHHLPDYIAQGLDTESPDLLERRARWNEASFEDFALPTEIWRETIDRFKRVDEILGKIRSGEITHINDLITYNLDIRAFAWDLLNEIDDTDFVKCFYGILQELTVLDPTCGSGAFLFAALNILEPLYEICIERMNDYQQKEKSLFADELNEITDKYRSNVQYFIYKSIILRNLYGVDIMVEATEIAKLRLFLKMVAVVEVDKYADNLGLDPLPDIDFNIRCGNTLVGYATEHELNDALENAPDFYIQYANKETKEQLESKMKDVAETYDKFRTEQLNRDLDIITFKRAKAALKEGLNGLNELLNKHLHVSSSGLSYKEWMESHQPFHWLAEFYQIMHDKGGFDVIIGNPPYVEYSSVRNTYAINGYSTLDSGNLYSFVIERSYSLSNNNHIGMIIPISAFCTARMASLISLIKTNSEKVLISNYAERPSKLFEGAERNLSIFLSLGNNKLEEEHLADFYTTYYYKWKSQNRNILFQNIWYQQSSECTLNDNIPKISSLPEIALIQRFRAVKKTIGAYIRKENSNVLYYKNSGGRYWKFISTFKPVFYLNKVLGTSSRESHLYFEDISTRNIVVALLNSDFYFWYYVMHSDARTNNPSDLKDFPFQIENLSTENRTKLLYLCDVLMQELQDNASFVDAKYRTGDVRFAQYTPALSRHTIIEIDKVIASHMQITDEELDFIINYDIKFRLGDEINEE